MKKNAVRVVIFIIGAVFVTIGVLNGEINAVFRTAGQLCLECIGIG
jgi:hypothetical protein